MLEIMVLSFRHETLNRTLVMLVETETLAEELDIDLINAGSTTCKRVDLARGFEPDTGFYSQRAGHIRSKDEIDLTVDPPPDLVIEIDITSPSLDKLPIYAAVGVPEVWLYQGHCQINSPCDAHQQKALRMTGGFKPLHASLPFTGGPVGVLTPVGEIPTLPMLHARQHLALGSSVALEFVRDQHARHIAQAFEQLFEEFQ
jgi:hypothetical protein